MIERGSLGRWRMKKYSKAWYLREFLAGRKTMLSVPSWVFGGRRCTVGKDSGNRCSQTSYDGRRTCHAHRAIKESFNDAEFFIQKRLTSSGVVRQTYLGGVSTMDGRTRG
jgi:hypothetical protein